MKSLNKILNESLFDKDLTTKELSYEKLLKLFSKKLDSLQIRRWVVGLHHNRIKEKIENKDLRDWCESLNGKYKQAPAEIGISMWDETSGSSDARNYLKFGEIHKNVSWNDGMYANGFDIPWSFWEDPNDIYEWVIFTCYPDDVAVVANRKSYDEIDQKLLHQLILLISRDEKKKRKDNEKLLNDLSSTMIKKMKMM